MKSYKPLLKHAILFLCAVFFSILSYCFFDIPLVDWADSLHLRDLSALFIKLTEIPEVINLAMYFLVPIMLLSVLFSKNIVHKKWFWVVILIAISLLGVLIIESSFEYIFGRYWPATWVDNNPSWLNNQVYGMNWFGGTTKGMQAFPSGHTAVIFAATTILFKFYPKHILLYITLCALTVIGLVAMYYHWLSDIICGAYIGYICAHISYMVYVKISQKYQFELGKI